MSTPSLLSLPAEVRLNIYSYLFEDESLHIDSCIDTQHMQTKQRQGPALAPILRTCRYLRDEASASYFSKVSIHLNVRKGIPATGLIQWMDSIGESNVRLLRNLTMRWENYVDISLELHRNTRGMSKDIAAKELPTIMLGSEVLFQAPIHNPTTSTRVGQKHILSMRGISNNEDRREYWKVNGTTEFCNALSRYLSPRIGATLEHRASYMTSREIVEFVDDASSHAASLRWLWYW